ncbi:hypothetical protein QO003_003534 [Arthrobacter silviterrae]|uniref:Uncharacterized protein n=1 Tax=Arthrobacter silviterrae TaxID=2026658 RepID=A0ABX0DE36_9MICC|nr:hypothetical protein [Arthrobacter silviterrae]MDQ0279231.1 hypothetical protein [Arthrobacter silviterrae]NGN83650.1 hypothetical protein [Arthrobacter silviterrae]
MSIPEIPLFAVLPDSADSRLLVDLTSHATDLSEALHTLQSAFDSGEDSVLWFPLTMHAVTAYVRPFIHSNVRDRLDQMTEFPGIPAELQSIHDTIRKYRNTTVAHSQSDLAMPVAVALLDKDGKVRSVQGWTLLQPMPGAVAKSFDRLICAMETIVDDATKLVAERLRERLRNASPEVIAAWPKPEILAARDQEFNGARRRVREPRFTNYWRIDSEIMQEDTRSGSDDSIPEQ